MVETYESKDEGNEDVASEDVASEDVANESDWDADLNEDAAPDPVAVYERPERSQGVSVSLIVAIVILLLLIVMAYFIFFV